MSQFKALSDCYKVYKVSSFRISHCAATDGQIEKINKLAIRAKELEKENKFLSKTLESWRKSHEELYHSSQELKARMEWQERKYSFIVFVLLILLTSQIAAVFLK